MPVTLRKRNIRKQAIAGSANQDDLPESLMAMAARAGPVRILVINIEDRLPELHADDHYRDAYVVLCRGGVCIGDVMINLTTGLESIHNRLRETITSLQAMVPDLANRPVVVDSDLPYISIVIPTIVTRTDALRRCIECIEELDYPNYEVLLVDNRRLLPESDPLPGLVDGKALRVIRESRPGVSAARNAGVANADSDVIAFVDDDVRVDRQWLRAIGTRLAMNPEMEVVTGLILPAEMESPAQIWYERYYGGFNGPRTFLPLTLEADPRSPRLLRGSRILTRDSRGAAHRSLPVYGIGAYSAGANMTFRKSTIERIGYFDVALGTGTPALGGEDLAAIITVLWTGGKMGYEPSAVTYHQHRREYSELLRMLDGNGLGFTAMLASLVRSDPRHLLGLSSQFSSAVKKIVVERGRKIRGMSADETINQKSGPLYPSFLAKREFRAFLRGPLGYFRSRLWWRKLSSAHSRLDDRT
jgi:glycosyltransferase involved in cell wall biosynthesis